MKRKIKSFEDMIAWQKAHQLSLAIYRYTAKMPETEKFGLRQQMRRATISVSSNIAEGFSRETAKGKLNFYNISSGSLSELRAQLLVSEGLGYIEQSEFTAILDMMNETGKLINGLRRYLKTNSIPEG